VKNYEDGIDEEKRGDIISNGRFIKEIVKSKC